MSRTVGGVVAVVVIGVLLSLSVQAAGAADASREPAAGELICTEGLFEFDTSGEPGYGWVWAPDNSTINFQMTWNGTFSFGFLQWKTGGLVDLDLVDESGGVVFSKTGPVTMPNYPGEDGYDWRWEDEDFPDPNSPPPPEPFELSASTTISGGGVFRISADIDQTPGHGWYENLFVSVEVVDSNGFPVTEEIPECSPTSPEENFGPNDSLEGQCSTQGTTDNPVDTRTGNEFMPLPGVLVEGRGPGLDLRVGYNSLDAAYDGPIGHGWRHTYDMQLILNPDGTRSWIQETGAHVVFHEVDPGVWRPAARMNAALEDLGGGDWKVTRTKCEFFTFNSAGQLTEIADKNGYSTDLHYSGSPSVLDYVEDEAGRQLDYVWSNGRVDSITEVHTGPEAKRSISFTYDTNGDLTTYSDIGGGDWVMGYTSHLLETVRLPRQTDPSKVLENHYDSQGRVDWQEDELNRRTSIVYEDAVSPPAGVTPVVDGTIVVEPDGDMRVDYYDSSGRRYGVTYGHLSADEVVTAIWYDPLTNMPRFVLDGEQEVWTIEYQDDFYPSLVTDPLGRDTQMTYNGFGQMTELIDAELITTTWEYDTAGNLEKVISADGSTDETTTEFLYDDPFDPGVVAGDVRRVIDGRGMVWRASYDATTGDVVSTTDPEGNETTYVFNSIGWLRDITEPKGNLTGATPEDFTTHLLYNDYGDVIQVTNPEDEHTTIDYDGNRNVEQVSNNDNEVTRYQYTDADELWKVISAWNTADESTTTYTYHPDGRRHTWANGLNNSWTYLYDAVGRLASEEDPNSEVTSYDYDDRGLLTELTQPGGDCQAGPAVGCVTFGYDAAGQLETIDYSDPGTPDVAYTYDDLGRRDTATTSAGTWDWDWTDRSQLESYTDADLRIVDYVWDDTGNLEEITYPGQTLPVVYGYDDAGRMESITDWLGNITDVDWDENSNLDLITFPTATGNSDDFEYDNANRIESIDFLDGIASLGSISYGRDPDGLLNNSTTTGLPTGPQSYGYDARNQLTTIDTQTAFEYDDAGNLTQTADGRLQVFDPSQQLCWTSPTATSGSCASPPSDAATYGYDARGNRTDHWASNGDHQQFGFDQANRLITADVADHSGDQFHSVAPATILDTTAGFEVGECPTTTSQCGSFNATNGYLRTVQVAGLGGLPPAGEIEAVILNVTAKNTSVAAGSDAFLSLYPSDISWPWSFHLAFRDSDYVSNTIITRVDDNGQVNVVVSGGDADVNLTVHGYFTKPDPDTGDGFVAVNPAAILHYGAPQIGDCGTATCGPLTFATPSLDVKVLGQGGVPNDSEITAVAVNIAVAEPTVAGAILLGPTGGPVSANLVFQPGQSSANSAIVPIGTDGRITIGALWSEADATITVQGYFTGDPEADEGGLHLFESPSVLLMTSQNPPIGNCPPPSTSCDTLVASQILDVQVTGEAGIPTENVDAVVVNYTVTDPTADGWIITWPYNSPFPWVATVFYEAGETSGTSAILPVDPATGRIQLATSAGIDLRIDVQGYMSSSDTVTFDYDADGLRTSKTSTHTGTTDYVWDRSGGLPLLLTETVDGVDTQIIYGPGGRPLTEITGTTAHWYHSDHLGSTRLITDNTGTVVGEYTYEPYGQLANSTGPYEPVLGYAGQYQDEETGFIYLRARYYDPNTGQFITRDPIVYATGDPYAYAFRSPTNATDPTGLVAVPVIAGGIGGIVGGLTGGIQHLATNGFSDPRGFAGSVLGGAVGGAVVGACSTATGNVLACGALGSAAGGATAGWLSGDGYSARQAFIDLTTGGLLNATINRFSPWKIPSNWAIPSRLSNLWDPRPYAQRIYKNEILFAIGDTVLDIGRWLGGLVPGFGRSC